MIPLFLALLLVAQAPADHKFYFSSTTIELNNRTQNMEVTVKLFTDDLERALGGSDEIPLRIGDEREVSDVNDRIRDYVQQHLIVNVDGRPVNLSFVGKENEMDITYCYFEFPPPPAIHVIEVRNTIFIDLFDGQKNVVDVIMDGWQKTLFFTKAQTTQTVYR